MEIWRNMGRRIKYHTEEERQAARRIQSLERRSEPGAKEGRRQENRKAYAKRKVVIVPEPPEVVRALSSMEIGEHSLFEHLFLHHSIIPDPLELPAITLTDADFKIMMGHPPYPSHIIGLPSFEKDWPVISAVFHGYANRRFVSEQEKWIVGAVLRDRAALSSELTKSYRILMREWEQYGVDVRDHGHPDHLATEFIAFQNRLWTSRRLMWLAEDLKQLAEGEQTEALFVALRARLKHFR
ncbi:hypothetical protein H1R20_g6610, partial [Candolleomyces eurysporus]